MNTQTSRREFLKLSTAALAGLALQPVLAACRPTPTPAAAREVSFSLWYRYFWEPVGPAFEGFIDQFQSKYPNIKLEKNMFGDEDYKSTIKVAMASDEPPDLFYAYGGNWLKFFVDAGLVADISAYWAQYKWEERLVDRALKEVKYDGKYYAVPTELTTAGIYYNKRIFQEVGLEPPEAPTWDEFLGYCEKIKAAGYLPLCLGNKEGGWTQWWWDYAVAREGGNAYRNDVVRGDIPLNDKGVVTALERINTDIFTSGYMNDNINGLDIFGWPGMMAEGQTGMTLIHSFLPPQLIAALMPEPFEQGFFLYPQVHQSVAIANDLYVEGNQCISAKNAYKDEGALWLDFIISAEVQAEWAKTSFIPTVEGQDQHLPELTRNIYAIVDKYDTFAHLDLVFHPEVVTAIFSNIQAMLNRELTPQQAMDNAQKVAETVPWVGVPQGEAA